MRFFLRGFALTLGLTMTVSLSASEGGSEDAAALADQLAEYSTFQASFTQYLADGSGSRVQDSRGELKARRPGYFYWRTEPPLEQVIVSDGQSVTVYDPDLLQATIYPMEQQVAATPALLLSGEVVDLDASFEVSHKRANDNVDQFTLIPRQPDSLFLELRMVFVDGVLDEMRLFDSLEQLSILMFEDVVLNEEIDDSVFELEFGDEVDVIREQDGL